MGACGSHAAIQEPPSPEPSRHVRFRLSPSVASLAKVGHRCSESDPAPLTLDAGGCGSNDGSPLHKSASIVVAAAAAPSPTASPAPFSTSLTLTRSNASSAAVTPVLSVRASAAAAAADSPVESASPSAPSTPKGASEGSTPAVPRRELRPSALRVAYSCASVVRTLAEAVEPSPSPFASPGPPQSTRPPVRLLRLSHHARVHSELQLPHGHVLLFVDAVDPTRGSLGAAVASTAARSVHLRSTAAASLHALRVSPGLPSPVLSSSSSGNPPDTPVSRAHASSSPAPRSSSSGAHSPASTDEVVWSVSGGWSPAPTPTGATAAAAAVAPQSGAHLHVSPPSVTHVEWSCSSVRASRVIPEETLVCGGSPSASPDPHQSQTQSPAPSHPLSNFLSSPAPVVVRSRSDTLNSLRRLACPSTSELDFSHASTLRPEPEASPLRLLQPRQLVDLSPVATQQLFLLYSRAARNALRRDANLPGHGSYASWSGFFPPSSSPLSTPVLVVSSSESPSSRQSRARRHELLDHLERFPAHAFLASVGMDPQLYNQPAPAPALPGMAVLRLSRWSLHAHHRSASSDCGSTGAPSTSPSLDLSSPLDLDDSVTLRAEEMGVLAQHLVQFKVELLASELRRSGVRAPTKLESTLRVQRFGAIPRAFTYARLEADVARGVPSPEALAVMQRMDEEDAMKLFVKCTIDCMQNKMGANSVGEVTWGAFHRRWWSFCTFFLHFRADSNPHGQPPHADGWRPLPILKPERLVYDASTTLDEPESNCSIM